MKKGTHEQKNNKKGGERKKFLNMFLYSLKSKLKYKEKSRKAKVG